MAAIIWGRGLRGMGNNPGRA